MLLPEAQLPLGGKPPSTKCPQGANICGRRWLGAPELAAAPRRSAAEGSARWMGSLRGGAGLGPTALPPGSD